MKYILSLILFFIMLSSTTEAQNTWIPYQPTAPVSTTAFIQPILVQQPVIVYNYPIYQLVPTVTYQPVFVQQRFLFCDRSYWINQQVVRWTYQPIYR